MYGQRHVVNIFYGKNFGGQVPSIQQSAALALGRLANYSDDLAEAVVGNEILPQLVYSLSEQNRCGGLFTHTLLSNQCTQEHLCPRPCKKKRTVLL